MSAFWRGRERRQPFRSDHGPGNLGFVRRGDGGRRAIEDRALADELRDASIAVALKLGGWEQFPERAGLIAA